MKTLSFRKRTLGALLYALLALGADSIAIANESSPAILESIGSNYFIAQTEANANDENPGTKERPFKSINGALKKLKLAPGDTLWIKNGTYRESLRLSTRNVAGVAQIPSGKSFSKMISFLAYPGHKPIIKGSDIVREWQKYKDNIWVRENWEINSQQLFADGKILEQIGGEMSRVGLLWRAWKWKYKDKSLKNMVAGSFYCDIKEKKLYAWLKDDGDPNDHLMEAATRKSLIFVDGKLEYLRFSGLTLRHGNNYSTDFALSILGKNCLVDDIDQAWHAFGGGMVGGEYLTFSNCKFNRNGNNGMGGRRRGHRILNCETSYNNYRNWGTGWHAGGSKFVPSCHDWVLKGHVSSYNNGDGIWFDHSASNVTIEGCLSFRNKGYGIHYEISSRAVIKNNICYENGGRGIYISNSSHCLISNNLCYRNGMAGIVLIGVTRRLQPTLNRGKDGIMPAGHNIVTGNIMVNNSDTQRLLKLYESWPLSANFKEFFRENYEKFKTWTNRPELIMPSERDVNSGCFSDYNIIYRDVVEKNPKWLAFGCDWEVDYAHGIDEWREKTGWDKHSIVAKTKFVDEAKYDFHPKDDCPSLWFCKKRDGGIKYDFDGKLRPGSASPITAGPFGGDEELFKKAVKSPESGKFLLFPLPRPTSKTMTWQRGCAIRRGLADSLKAGYVSATKAGIKIDGIPFIAEAGDGGRVIALDKETQKNKISPDKSAKEVYFLLSAMDCSDKPFARCTISREDGVKIIIEWKGDGKGRITTTSNDNPKTKEGWRGKSRYFISGKGFINEEHTAFITTWENENQWLPLKTMDFELLDDNAKVAIIAITGTKIIK